MAARARCRRAPPKTVYKDRRPMAQVKVIAVRDRTVSDGAPTRASKARAKQNLKLRRARRAKTKTKTCNRMVKTWGNGPTATSTATLRAAA